MRNPLRHLRVLGAVAFFLVSPGGLTAAPALLIQNGQKIGFMGDSITAQGNEPEGYIHLVIGALKAEGVEAVPIPAGVPGHTSSNMRSRLEVQVLNAGAHWMTLSCGVNDVLMQKKGRGVDLESYKKNVTAMVEMAGAHQVKVVLLTATPLGENLDDEANAQLAGYNDFLRAYAKEKNLVLADVNATFRDYLKTAPAAGETPGKRLLADGVHPNKTGQMLMAKTVIAALGVPASDLPKIETAWLENPVGKGVKVPDAGLVLISQKQYQALVKIAHDRPSAVAGLIAPLWKRALAESPEAKNGAAAADPAKAKAAAQSAIGALVDEFIKTSGASGPAKK
ncbi:MAG: GDSL-type esterase/lipase family protein [Chthoniobacteraceae bacterium]|nr:GDSL-type esterase/lipase family protein [Chthoniobacteraceae bacterium]